MNNRRGFLALVGGALLTGQTLSKFGYSRPTLILPPNPMKLPSLHGQMLASEGLTGYPLLDAMFAQGKTQVHVFLGVKQAVPEDLFLEWLEGGLRMVDGCKPGGQIWRAMQAEGRT